MSRVDLARHGSLIVILSLGAGCPDGHDPPLNATLSATVPMDSNGDDGGDVGDGDGGEPTTTTTADGSTTGDGPVDETTGADTSSGPGETTVEPCEPTECEALACGSVDDGCSGELDCGGCPDGLSCQDGQCAAKEFATAAKLWSTNATTYPVRAVGWSADGGRIATGGCADFPTEGEYVVWDAMGAGPVWGYQYPDSAVLNLAWSPDGSAIVLGTQGSAPQIYNAKTGDAYAELGCCHDWEINAVDWRADGKQIASAGAASANPGAYPEWCVWDPVTQTKVHSETADDTWAVNGVSFSPDGESLAVVTDELFYTVSLKTYETEQFAVLGDWLDDPWVLDGVTWSPDNLRLLVWSQEVFLIVDLESGDIGGLSVAGGITGATWSPSGFKFAISLANGKVRVYDRLSGDVEVQFTAHDVVTAIDWSFHEQYLATGGETPRLAVWRLEY